MIADLRTYLLLQSSLTDLIGQRLYYLRVPEIVNYPYVVFYIVSNPDERNEIGQDGSSPFISFNIITQDSLELENISDVLRNILQDVVDVTFGASYIYSIKRKGSRDLFDSEEMDDIKYYSRTDDYMISYNI